MRVGRKSGLFEITDPRGWDMNESGKFALGESMAGAVCLKSHG
nr:hypothetical protein [uncultured Sphingomonas sp.]